MFDAISLSEIALVLLLALFLFDARDLVKTARFLGAQYRRLEQYWRKLQSDLLTEPPTPEELKAKAEIDRFYEEYRQKAGRDYNPYTDPPRPAAVDAAVAPEPASAPLPENKNGADV